MRSHAAGRLTKSVGDIRVTLAPKNSPGLSWQNRPMSWWSGIQEPTASSAPKPVPAAQAIRLARMSPWASITPFGSPIDPELY